MFVDSCMLCTSAAAGNSVLSSPVLVLIVAGAGNRIEAGVGTKTPGFGCGEIQHVSSQGTYTMFQKCY